MNISWHLKTFTQVCKELNSDTSGLSQKEADSLLLKFGNNSLPEQKVDSYIIIFLKQFQSPLIYILLGASIVVFFMHEYVDASIIMAILIFNSVIGVMQEGKAQNALQALKKFVETKATVVRDGEEIILEDKKIVPGDVIILEEGEKVPADAYVIESFNLKIDESSISGESEAKNKVVNLKGSKDKTDFKNFIFKGTNIVSGNGKALVVATGYNTFVGKIAKEITKIDSEMPLKTTIRHLSRLIIIVSIIICTLIFIAGIFLDYPLKEMFTIVVSLAVSVIPEGLPIVITMILATGVWRMSKQNALIKKLQAVEALGQAKIIAVDKTGTLTKNELVIKNVFIDNKNFDVEGVGYEPNGSIKIDGNTVDPLNHPELLLSGKIALFCCSARLMFSEETQMWKVSGDPTEAAMLSYAQKVGFHKEDAEHENPLLAKLPFDYKLKFQAAIHKVDGNNFLALAGAPEEIIKLSTTIYKNDKICELDEDQKTELKNVFTKMSKNGLRVVAFAMNNNYNYDNIDPKNLNSLTFVGYFAMKDDLRVEVQEAMRKAKEAGIKVVMITGDYEVTAQAIAKDAGIYKKGDKILTGEAIDKLSNLELINEISNVTVFARVNPEHKLKIVNAFKLRGEIIAMTGDGVNDAPSLVAADLGVSMGKIGTEVAKEASDIVLLDDNFGSIISAVEEGRNIYKTIKKVVLYLFSTSLGEVLIISGALFLALPIPLMPAQIIWLNFVTDGFLTIALAMEPKEKTLLKESFKKPNKYLIDKQMTIRMLLMAITMMITGLWIFTQYYQDSLVKGLTGSLTVLAVIQWFNAWNCRSNNKSIFTMNPLKNLYLIGATILVILLQIFAVYNPIANKILHTTPLEGRDWLLIILISLSIIAVDEIRKLSLKIFKHQ